MKTKHLIIFIALCFLSLSARLRAQSTNDILDIMVKKGMITKAEADTLHAEALRNEAAEKAKQKTFNIFSSKALQLNGFAQVRHQSNQQPGIPDGFDIRRARLDLKGTILPKLDYRFMTEFAGSPKITDAYIAYKPFDFLKLMAGQFKVPFSYESNSADDNMELIDRSQVVEALVARGTDTLGNYLGRDIGLMLYGSFLKVNDRFLFDYYLSVLNGQGINTLDKNEAKDFAGRFLIHPVKGLNIGASVYNGYDYITASSKNGVRQRYGAEAQYDYKRISIKSEYIAGKDFSINREGWYLQAAYFIIPDKFQAVVKLDSYDHDKDKQGDKNDWYIAGLNYFFGRAARIQVNYTNKRETGEEVKQTNNDLISVQFQIGF